MEWLNAAPTCVRVYFPIMLADKIWDFNLILLVSAVAVAINFTESN